MNVVEIVLIVLVVLAVGGALARRRQLARTEGRFETNLATVNRDLAAARAGDRGWDPDVMEQVARAAVLERSGTEPAGLELFRVVDRPGTDEDEAEYRGADGTSVTLGRRGGEWRAV